MARALGFRVEPAPDLGGPSGLLVGRTILVLQTLPPDVYLFTVGHEIAHAVSDTWRVFDTLPAALLEYNMDAVAAAVLMPRADLARAALLYGADPTSLALLFAPIPFMWAYRRARRLLGDLGR